MKKAVFVEMEGLLTPLNEYIPDEEKVMLFTKQLSDYCKAQGIKLYLISGYHGAIAKKKFLESVVKEFFSESQFIHVNDAYINNKESTDRDLHAKNLANNPEFNDAYFKQVEIKNFLEKEALGKDEVLLLADDVWVDGFYTIKFSGIDFAICDGNILERGKKIERIHGLAYFSFDFDSVKMLIEDFPEVDTSALEKFVFKKMSEILMKDVDFSGLVKKVADKNSSASSGFTKGEGA